MEFTGTTVRQDFLVQFLINPQLLCFVAAIVVDVKLELELSLVSRMFGEKFEKRAENVWLMTGEKRLALDPFKRTFAKKLLGL